MSDQIRFRRKAGALFALSVIFIGPALIRVSDLAASGAVRRVDLALILAGAFAAGSLFSLGMSAWRQRRAEAD